MRRILRAIVPAFVALSRLPRSRRIPLLGADALATDSGRFRLKVEMKLNARTSTRRSSSRWRTRARRSRSSSQTVSPHTSAEISNIALTAEGDLTPDILAKVVIHFLDLYNRNPTSSADRVFVREAFVRFGKKWEALKEMPGTTVYLELGKAPRFSKQIVRRLESYGLWGTAVNRFEETGAEAGGSFGPHVYWRASATGGTPLFFRDANALAGDNGTPERTVGSTTPVVYGSGFPILYDTMATDVNFSGRFQLGGGLGLRFNWGESRRDGVDLLGWYFRRDLADRTSRCTARSTRAISRLLEGFGVPLPVERNREIRVRRQPRGALRARAPLRRRASSSPSPASSARATRSRPPWRIALPGLFASGDQSGRQLDRAGRARLVHRQPLRRCRPASWRRPSDGTGASTTSASASASCAASISPSSTRATTSTTRRGVLHPDEGLLTLRAAF